MPSLVSHRRPLLAQHTIRCVRTAFALALFAGAPCAAMAQITLTHTEDASPIPAGMIRMRVTTGWTRFDERFTTSGRRSLGAEIAADSLGPRQLPRLAPVETGLQTLTNDPAVRLTFGRLAAQSDARIVTTPIVLEYGLSRRLSVGILVPLVQTRRSVSINIDTAALARGNVGFVPLRLRGDAANANTLVYNAFKRAADSLGVLISRCPTTPTASGCAVVIANLSDAGTTRTQAQRFADAIQTALGTDTATAFVAPRTALATRIDAERARLNAKLQQYLGAGSGATTSVFTAPTDFSYVDLQGRGSAPGLLQSPLGGGLDSIQTTNKLVLGGFTAGVQYLLIDRFRPDSLPPSGVQTRIAISGAFRYESLLPDSARKIGSISASEGSGFELRSVMDVIIGNLGGTLAAKYAHTFAKNEVGPLAGDPDAFYPYPFFGVVRRTPGPVITLDVTPRYLVGEWFAIDGHYGVERAGATTYERAATAESCSTCHGAEIPATFARTAQRIGFGVRYSTVDSFLRGGSKTPIEVSLMHLETISGSAGVAKVQRDQIQVRVFFGPRRR